MMLEDDETIKVPAICALTKADLAKTNLTLLDGYRFELQRYLRMCFNHVFVYTRGYQSEINLLHQIVNASNTLLVVNDFIDMKEKV